MADFIVNQLNQRLAKKVADVKPLNDPLGGAGGVSKFDQILNNKSQNLMFETLSQTIAGDDHNNNKMQVLPADNISINIQEGEFGQSSTFDGKKAIFNLFSTINSDALKMDSIIEVLSSDGTRLSRRQLLAYQASIGELTINTELFSKLAQSISQNLSTLLQTNMG